MRSDAHAAAGDGHGWSRQDQARSAHRDQAGATVGSMRARFYAADATEFGATIRITQGGRERVGTIIGRSTSRLPFRPTI